MTSRRPATEPPAIALIDVERGPLGIVVAPSPERLWAELQSALDRRAAAPQQEPLDFAAAMRRVEAEIYDAP